jgi:transcriptional regulator with GAF, ATPase, and Fis domain
VKLTLEVLRGERAGGTATLERGELTIGRGDKHDLAVTDWHVSTEHAKVVRTRRGFLYRDLFSTNGSVLVRSGDETPVDASGRQEILLEDGDVLRLGDQKEPVVIEVRIEEEDPTRDVLAVRRVQDVDSLAALMEQDPDRLRRLHDVTKRIAQALDLGEVLEEAVAAVMDVLPSATHAGIFLEEEGRFVLAKGRVDTPGDDTEPRLSKALARRVRSERAGVLASNAPEEVGSRSIAQANIQSTICTPLWRGANIYGLIQVDNRTAVGTFQEADLELLTVLASQFSHAVRNALTYERLAKSEASARHENRYMKGRDKAQAEIIGDSPAWRRVMEQVGKVQDTRVPVCIVGETGTGKELIAKAIHYGSNRADGLFVAQNMAALAESVLESELFGHVKGAFTGAEADKKGLFEIAHGGTIFLDEVTEMPFPLQAKLLRVLQEGEIRPVGATHPKAVDVRILSATNRELEKEVEAGTFRQDLYYRLMVFPVRVPPLRERKGDIAVLASHFLHRFSRELNRPAPTIGPKALPLLVAHAWPGNIRELENEVQRIVIQGVRDDVIEPEDLSPAVRSQAGGPAVIPELGGTLKETMAQVERGILERALAAHGGNKSRTAKTLSITREGLHKKLAKLGMN